MKIFRKVLIFLTVICIILLLVDMTIASNLIIIELSSVYLLCLILILISLFVSSKIVEKDKRSSKKITSICIISVTLLACWMFVSVSKSFHKNPQYYEIEIANIPDEREIVVYEYGTFRGKRGCLCVKINNFVYKRIKNTEYTIQSGTILENNLILSYNANTNQIHMKYKLTPDSEYIEQSAIIK